MNSLILSTKVEVQGVKPKGGTGVWHECGHPCITLATEPQPPLLHLSPGLWNHSSVRASFRSIERKAEISFSGRLVAVPFGVGLWTGRELGEVGVYFSLGHFSLQGGAMTRSRAPSRERPLASVETPAETLQTLAPSKTSP